MKANANDIYDNNRVNKEVVVLQMMWMVMSLIIMRWILNDNDN